MKDIHPIFESSNCRQLVGNSALRKANHCWSIAYGNSFGQLFSEASFVAGGSNANSWNNLEHRKIPHTVMAGAIWTGDSSAIKHKGDSRLVKGYIHQDLVKCPIHKCCIHRNDGVKTTKGHSSGRCNRVLFSNSNIEHSVWILGCKFVHTDWNKHRRSDANYRLVIIGNSDQLIGKY